MVYQQGWAGRGSEGSSGGGHGGEEGKEGRVGKKNTPPRATVSSNFLPPWSFPRTPIAAEKVSLICPCYDESRVLFLHNLVPRYQSDNLVSRDHQKILSLKCTIIAQIQLTKRKWNSNYCRLGFLLGYRFF